MPPTSPPELPAVGDCEDPAKRRRSRSFLEPVVLVQPRASDAFTVIGECFLRVGPKRAIHRVLKKQGFAHACSELLYGFAVRSVGVGRRPPHAEASSQC